MLIRLLPLAAFVALLPGCTGTLNIWTVNVDPLGGSGDDDDDDRDPQLDFSNYDGTEYINIDWDQEQAPAGVEDCAEEYEAFGANTTLDDSNLCPLCDHIWAVTLVAADPDLECLDGTGLQARETYIRRVGIEFIDDITFRYWRNRGDSDLALDPHGIGAFNGVEFTWSGIDEYAEEYPDAGITLFFSGEGEF